MDHWATLDWDDKSSINQFTQNLIILEDAYEILEEMISFFEKG